MKIGGNTKAEQAKNDFVNKTNKMKIERTSVVAVSPRRREKSQNHFSCLMTHDKVNQHHARKAELLYIRHVSLSLIFPFGKPTMP